MVIEYKEACSPFAVFFSSTGATMESSANSIVSEENIHVTTEEIHSQNVTIEIDEVVDNVVTNATTNATTTGKEEEYATTTMIRPAFLHNKMLSLSTSSIKSLLPNFYSITGGNNSTPLLGSTNNCNNVNNNSDTANNSQLNLSLSSDQSYAVSDELARESDVTVSTNVTPQAEYKGFASYVVSCIFLFVWVSWAFLPDRVLNSLGVYYYPSRWWALAVPSYVLVLMVYMYVGIALYDVEVLTLPLCDNRAVADDTGVVVAQPLFAGTSGVWDLPLVAVNEVLYGEEAERE